MKDTATTVLVVLVTLLIGSLIGYHTYKNLAVIESLENQIVNQQKFNLVILETLKIAKLEQALQLANLKVNDPAKYEKLLMESQKGAVKGQKGHEK